MMLAPLALLAGLSASHALSWQRHTIPLRGELVLTDVHAITQPSGAIVAYAAGEAGVLLKLVDAVPSANATVTPWTVSLNAGFPLYFYGVYSFDANNTILTGFVDGSGGAYGILQSTSDGGTTWSTDAVMDKTEWAGGPIEFADAANGLMPSTAGSVMWRTTSGGRSAAAWAEVTPSAGNWHSGNFAFDADGRAAIAGSTHCNSTDFGSSWQCGVAEDAAGMDGGLACDGAPGEPTTRCVTGGGEISPAVSGWVHLSEDGGRSYGPRVLTSAWPIRSLVAVKGTRVVVAAGGDFFSAVGGVYVSVDGGASFSPDLELGEEVKACRALPLPALRAVRVFCVSAGQAGGSIVSADVPL